LDESASHQVIAPGATVCLDASLDEAARAGRPVSVLVFSSAADSPVLQSELPLAQEATDAQR